MSIMDLDNLFKKELPKFQNFTGGMDIYGVDQAEKNLLLTMVLQREGHNADNLRGSAEDKLAVTYHSPGYSSGAYSSHALVEKFVSSANTALDNLMGKQVEK